MNSDDIRFVRSAMLTDWEGICSIKVSSTTPQSGGVFFLFSFGSVHVQGSIDQ